MTSQAPLQTWMPHGACDSHVHVFGPLAQYPVSADAPYTVPDDGPDQLLACMDAAGIQHAVIVHAAVSGRDNRRTLDALAQHPTRFRGVVLPPLEQPAAHELDKWHRQGVCGLRFSYTRTAQAGMSLQPQWAACLAERGWHAQLHVEADQLLMLEPELQGLPVPLVIDHMARIPAGIGTRHPAFDCLRRLLDQGHVWVKLSAPMRLSQTQTYPYGDVTPLARALAQHAPERVLWGSDWPHVNLQASVPPYADMLALLHDWLPDPGARQQVLVDNAVALYRLDPTAPPGASPT